MFRLYYSLKRLNRAIRPAFYKDGYTLSGRAYVEDGDTIYIDKESIRIFGIDAPELNRPYGKAAKTKMFELCRGKRVRAVLTGEGSYERYVARCYLPDGRDIAEEMVKAGLALDYPKFSNGEYRRFEPVGIRKKLFEKARTVSMRYPSGQFKIGKVVEDSIRVEGYCFGCGHNWLVDTEKLLRKFGPNLNLLGRIGPCRNEDCTDKAIMRAVIDDEYWPLV